MSTAFPNWLPPLALIPLLMGCKADIDDVQASVSEQIRTVVNVSWTTSKETTGYVEYGPSESYGFSTPLESEAALEHQVSLMGMTADTDCHFRVVVPTDDGDEVSETGEIITGSLPAELPGLTVSGQGQDHFSVVPIIGSTTGPMIINSEGEFIWYHIEERELDVYRTRVSVDGQSVLYNAASVSGEPDEGSEIVRVAYDGSWEESIPIPLLAHDFVEHADGTIGAMVVEYRDFEGEDLRGDQIIEVAPDGTQTTIWSAWDCFDPSEITGDDMEIGWTFANALDYDPDEQAYYLSLRNFSSIIKIDRASGECLWGFGGEANSFDIASGSETFMHEHQFQVLDDSILIFDNDGAVTYESRVLEYSFDQDNQQAEQIWEYTADPSIYVFVLGDVHRFDDGDTLVTWSVSGQMDRVDSAGQAEWTLNSDLGYAFGFNTLTQSLYGED